MQQLSQVVGVLDAVEHFFHILKFLDLLSLLADLVFLLSHPLLDFIYFSFVCPGREFVIFELLLD